MSENAKKPRIRFKGFTDAWEQRKLGETVQIVMGQSPDGATYSDKPSKYILVQGNADLENGWVKPRVWTTQKTKIGEAGDLIMSVRAPAGSMGKTAYNVVLGRGVAAIKGNEFIYQLLVKKDLDGYWKRLSAGSTFESLNSETIFNAEICEPKKSEQEKIGAYFETIDNLITLHQRKYDKLVDVKKSLLEKMFPQGEENTPKIRFKGFTETWEQRKLSYYMETSNEKNIDNKYSAEDVLSVSGDYGVVNQIEFQGRSFAGASVQNYGILCTNDIVYTKSPLKANPYGIIKTNKGKTGIVSVLYGIFKPNENVYPSFVQTYFEQNARLNNYLRPLVNKGAKNTLLISDDDSINGDVSFPKVDEQKQIGYIFEQLDNLITLHQRKLEKLKNVKSALLEKMFV